MLNSHLSRLNQNKYKILTLTILIILLIAPTIYLSLIFKDIFQTNNYKFELCTDKLCHELFVQDFATFLNASKEFIYFSAQIITLASISIAALTYVSSKKNNDIAIANNYFSIFRSIAENSFDINFRKLNNRDINYQKLFQKIYPNINKGVIDISSIYIEDLQRINNSIDSIKPDKIKETSNNHKTVFLSFCNDYGIQIENDFNNRVFLIIENEIVEFINRLNQSIFKNNIHPKLKIRTFR